MFPQQRPVYTQAGFISLQTNRPNKTSQIYGLPHCEKFSSLGRFFVHHFSTVKNTTKHSEVHRVMFCIWTPMQVWLIPIADERVDVQVKLWDPLRTRAIAIPERFWSGVSRKGAISSVRTFTFTFTFTQFEASLNPAENDGEKSKGPRPTIVRSELLVCTFASNWKMCV